MTISIRSAGAADEANIIALWHACGLVLADNDPVRDFGFVMASANYELLIACKGDGIVGSIVTGHDSTRGWLSHV